MNENYKGIIAVVIVVVVIAGALILLNYSDKNSANGNVSANLTVIGDDYFDFGEVSMEKGVVTHDFTLENNGEYPINIGKIYTSCMCTTADIVLGDGKEIGPFGMQGHSGILRKADVEIKPGEKFIVKAIYDPAAHGPSGVGFAQRSIYLETNSSVQPKIELSFQANVTK